MDQTERHQIIQAIFACGEDEARQLGESLRLVEAKSADIIAFQGDESAECQFVVSGAVGLHALGNEGQYTQVATVEPGEVFGAFPENSANPVEAVAQSAVQMLVIGTAQLRELASNHAAIASGLASRYAAQLTNVIGRLAARVTLSARGRVFAELLELANEENAIAPVPVVSALAVKAQTSRETASRAISDLERRGVMERQNDRWQIVAPRILEDLVL